MFEPLPTRMTPEEYLAFERASDEKHEYIDGEIYAMAGAKESHVLIVTNLVASLAVQLRGTPCRVYSTDMKVQVSPTKYVYPDVVVTCEESQFSDETRDVLLNPALIIEVLSPSTQDYDRGQKFAHYRGLASLREYLTIAQDKIHVEQHVRQPTDQWLLTDFLDSASQISLHTVDAVLSLTEVYEKVVLEE